VPKLKKLERAKSPHHIAAMQPDHWDSQLYNKTGLRNRCANMHYVTMSTPEQRLKKPEIHFHVHAAELSDNGMFR
jgi:hypothetical protein